MIISFYSFKGGVGRTQLLANVAACLCHEFHKRVLLIDWDLEAPGLRYFFQEKIQIEPNKDGLLDLLGEYIQYMKTRDTNPETAKIPTFNEKHIQSCYNSAPQGCIDLVLAGKKEDYYERLHAFDWDEFSEKYDGKNYIEWLKEDLQSRYDYILIDSRTGRTTYGGIVNIQMAAVSVLVMAPSGQNYEGCLDVMHAIERSDYATSAYRAHPLMMPILSRVDVTVTDKVNLWTDKFENTFAPYYQRLLDAAGDEVKVQAANYINSTFIPYNKEIAFGENVLFPISKEPHIEGFETKIRNIIGILQNVKQPAQRQPFRAPNLRYTNSLLNDNLIRISDRYYSIDNDFKNNILFIHIETLSTQQYAINITLKNHSIYAELLEKDVETTIPIGNSDQTNPLQDAFNQYQQGISHAKTATLYEAESALVRQLLAIFRGGDIEMVCQDFVQIVENQRIKDLIIVIASDKTALLDLPFERILPSFLTDKTQLSHPAFGIVRSKATSAAHFILPKPTSNPSATLKVLFMVVLPDDLKTRMSNSDAIAFDAAQQEWIVAMEAIHADKSNCWIEFLYLASLQEIDAALRSRAHDVVHLSTYAVYSEPQQTTLLSLEDSQGEPVLVSAETFGKVLMNHNSIQLLVLNVFEPFPIPLGAQLEGQIATYVRSVVTVRLTNRVEAILPFTTAFYGSLANGSTLTAALHQVQRLVRENPQKTPISGGENGALPITVYYNEWLSPFVHIEAPKNPTILYPIAGFVPTKHTRLIGRGFIGRKQYLIQMQQAFRADQPVCLYGLGGLGKTTLAEAFAYQYALQEKAEMLIFREPIRANHILEVLSKKWAEIQPMPESLEQFMKMQQPPPLEKLKTLIQNYPRNAKLVLLFDNLELVQPNVTYSNPTLKAFLTYLCAHAPE
ncbi:MAG: hypothetical protein RLZZ628_4045, partial [Bacteroidota bacterium]